MPLTTYEQDGIPRHVAIIMDGNGRWAIQQGKMRIIGHHAGVKTVKKTIKHALDKGINVLTLYAFSSENWNRPANEVTALMMLFAHVLNREIKKLHKKNVRLLIIGDKSKFSEQLQKMMANAEALTVENNGLILVVAANYGGRWDIVQATKEIALQVRNGDVDVDQIDQSLISQHMCLSCLPPIDLVIRTGGEQRISNFLLWQVAYSEFYFTPILWPDFDESAFDMALNDFIYRERRFGTTEPIKE